MDIYSTFRAVQNCGLQLWMSMSVCIASHYRTVPLMLSVHRVLLKKHRFQQATEASDVQIWIVQKWTLEKNELSPMDYQNQIDITKTCTSSIRV